MNLKEKVAHLERCYDDQVVIARLREDVNSLRKEMEAVKDYIEIRVESHKVIAISTKPSKGGAS